MALFLRSSFSGALTLHQGVWFALIRYSCRKACLAADRPVCPKCTCKQLLGKITALPLVDCVQSAKQLKEWGANDDEILVGDILTSGSGLLARAMEGADALVIATSAVPQIKPLSFIKVGGSAETCVRRSVLRRSLLLLLFALLGGCDVVDANEKATAYISP